MRVNRTDKILGEVLQRDRDGRPSQGVRVRFRERASDLLSTVLGGEYEEVLLMPSPWILLRFRLPTVRRESPGQRFCHRQEELV
jgi:hypothetical protein